MKTGKDDKIPYIQVLIVLQHDKRKWDDCHLIV